MQPTEAEPGCPQDAHHCLLHCFGRVVAKHVDIERNDISPGSLAGAMMVDGGEHEEHIPTTMALLLLCCHSCRSGAAVGPSSFSKGLSFPKGGSFLYLRFRSTRPRSNRLNEPDRMLTSVLDDGDLHHWPQNDLNPFQKEIPFGKDLSFF